jgi:phosphoglycolate phosphatase
MQGGVIFDLDGTLLDTHRTIAAAHNRVLRQLGYPEHADAAYKQFVGDGAWKCVERALPTGAATAEHVEDFLTRYRTDYARSFRVDTAPYAGIPELLDRLRDDGTRMAVLSNKDDAFTQEIISHFFAPDTFDYVIGFKPEFGHKPKPDGGLHVAKQLGIDPAHTVFLGDTHVDIETAVACHMLPIGVSWGFRDVAELNAAGAQHIIDQPQDLLALLAKLP